VDSVPIAKLIILLIMRTIHKLKVLEKELILIMQNT